MDCSKSGAVGLPAAPFIAARACSTSLTAWHNFLRSTSFHVPCGRRHASRSVVFSSMIVSNSLCPISSYPIKRREHFDHNISLPIVRRREAVVSSIALLASVLLNISADHPVAAASEFADMPALKGKDYGKTKMSYPDYIETKSGLQYKDLRIGNGPVPKPGEMVVVDWDGYTIGYYGRIFEARNKTKGGSFEGGDKAFFKFRLGYQEVIPAFEEAVAGMSLGGIRRIIVPPELGYPENDFNKSGPRPTTFSGQRALDFVLRNQGLIDKTLLFDIELLKIIPT